MAQWIAHLTTNQEVEGSSPFVVAFLLIIPIKAYADK
jgi:hypothetical protein